MARQPKPADVAAEDFKKQYGYYLKDETKGQAFSRIASRRMTQALDEIRKIETLADTNNYEYDEEQVAKMLEALGAACTAVADRFAGKVKGKAGFTV